MAIQIKNTNDIGEVGAKILVYGSAGSGKTSLIPSLPSPIVISAEGGLLSIQDAGIPYIEIASMDDLREVYMWLLESDEAKAFQSVALDSISEVAEVVLAEELNKKTKDGLPMDGRKAYGEMNTTIGGAIRSFRNLPGRNVYMTAKLEKSQDEMGKILYNPSMPGKSLTMQLPYFFDFVFALRVEKDAEGVSQRALMCDSDGLWLAKSRSHKLEMWEAPDLGAIIAKIGA